MAVGCAAVRSATQGVLNREGVGAPAPALEGGRWTSPAPALGGRWHLVGFIDPG